MFFLQTICQNTNYKSTTKTFGQWSKVILKKSMRVHIVEDAVLCVKCKHNLFFSSDNIASRIVVNLEVGGWTKLSSTWCDQLSTFQNCFQVIVATRLECLRAHFRSNKNASRIKWSINSMSRNLSAKIRGAVKNRCGWESCLGKASAELAYKEKLAALFLCNLQELYLVSCR